MEEQLKTLNCLHADISAALKIAAEIMSRKGPQDSSHTFSEGQLVWLEGTNIKMTHPKAKLADKRLGPFKIIYIAPINSHLLLSKTWCIHSVFHNSLFTPYKETTEHGPNFTWPSLDIVEDKTDHYKVEKVLDAKPIPNHRSILYKIKWKGYPDSENE